MNRRLFFGSLVGLGAATSVQVDTERQPESIRLVLEVNGRDLAQAVVWHIPSPMKAKLLRPEAAKGLED